MFSLLLVSRLLLASRVFLGGPAVALPPVVASDPAVAGILGVASFPADPVVAIVLMSLHSFLIPVQLDILVYRTTAIPLFFFCKRTIGISNTGMMNSRHIVLSGFGSIILSDSGISDAENN